MCQSSLAFDLVDVPRLKRMLKAAAPAPQPDATGGKVTQLAVPRFARDPGHFETRPHSTEEEDS